jgi:hypothetical protein
MLNDITIKCFLLKGTTASLVYLIKKTIVLIQINQAYLVSKVKL